MLLRQMSSMKEGGSTGAAMIMFNIISESCQNMYSALFFGDYYRMRSFSELIYKRLNALFLYYSESGYYNLIYSRVPTKS